MKIAPLALALSMSGLAAVSASPAQSAPIAFAANGHYYEFVRAQSVSWQEALALSANATPMAGYESYLATITSSNENSFIRLLLMMAGSPTNVWLAGADQGTEGVWRWAAGPELNQIFYGPGAPLGSYVNWNAGQPDNFGGQEDFLQMTSNVGLWNDVASAQTSGGYIVEYSRAVPEPAVWALMLTGFGLAGATLRRRRAVPAQATEA